MPTFDVVSEVDKQEILNALDQARKELATRFDFKGSSAKIDFTKENIIELSAEDGSRLKGLHDIVVGKLANETSIYATSTARTRSFPRSDTRSKS